MPSLFPRISLSLLSASRSRGLFSVLGMYLFYWAYSKQKTTARMNRAAARRNGKSVLGRKGQSAMETDLPVYLTVLHFSTGVRVSPRPTPSFTTTMRNVRSFSMPGKLPRTLPMVSVFSLES